MSSKQKKYHLTTLPTGLRVLSFPMAERKSLVLGVWASCGGRYERLKEAGISHFIEHMVFKGTKKYNCVELKKAVEGVGGYLNAFTAEEFTCYFSKVTAKYLKPVVDVLSDMALSPNFKESDFNREKFVILEEIKLYLDLPSHYVVDILFKLLWPNQSLGMFLAGTPDTINPMTHRDLRKFKETYYTAPNMCVVATGDVSHQALVKEVKRAFKSVKKGEKNTFAPAVKTQDKARLKIVEKKLEQTHLALGFHCAGRRDKNRYAESLLNVILGGNMSSRLFQEVREKKGLAYEISSHVKRYDETGAFVINAGIHNERKEETIKVILRELKKITKKGPSMDELKRAKEYYRGHFMLALEDTTDTMIWLGENLLGLERIEDEQAILRKISVVTSRDIKKAAARLFDEKNLNLSVLGPLKSKEEKEIEKLLKI